MVIFNGEPQNYTDMIKMEMDWNSCVGLCYENVTCVAAHSNEQGCHLFMIGRLLELKKLEAYSGKLMAVKMIADTTCSLNYDGNSMYGTYQLQNQTLNYTITAKNDTWEFTTIPLYSCPPNFKLFSRRLGLWCMTVSVGRSSSRCHLKFNGSDLSGFDSEEEIIYIRDITVPLYNTTSKYKYDGYWINGIRTVNCLYANQTGPECQRTRAFNITDPLLSTTDWYQWGYDNKPDVRLTDVGPSNCVGYRVNRDGGAGLDDFPCGMYTLTGEITEMKGYVCGMRPEAILP